ncbi:MAG: DNA modification system-associated small protein, partial [Promethearchaeota archaeon]
ERDKSIITFNGDNEQYLDELKKICEKQGVPMQLIERLLIVEKDMSTMSHRSGIFNRLERVIGEHVMNEMRNEIKTRK